QHADDAQRDHPDGRAVEKQVDQVVRREKQRVEAGKHDGNDDKSDHHRQHAEVAGTDPVEEAAEQPDGAVIVPDALVGAIDRLRGPVAHGVPPAISAAFLWLRRDTAFSVAPVIAVTSSWLLASGSKMPLLRPRRSTTMRSATAR